MSELEVQREQKKVLKWFKEFQDAKYYTSLNTFQQNICLEVLLNFTEKILCYEFMKVKDWDPDETLVICRTFFHKEGAGPLAVEPNVIAIMYAFFRFLDDRKYHPYASELVECVKKMGA